MILLTKLVMKPSALLLSLSDIVVKFLKTTTDRKTWTGAFLPIKITWVSKNLAKLDTTTASKKMLICVKAKFTKSSVTKRRQR
jgi:hypothetical protein